MNCKELTTPPYNGAFSIMSNRNSNMLETTKEHIVDVSISFLALARSNFHNALYNMNFIELRDSLAALSFMGMN